MHNTNETNTPPNPRYTRCTQSPGNEIEQTLYRLGITAKYTGFFHACRAAELVKQQPERLMMVTKWLYPEVAKQFGTKWCCVERNIRTVAELAWRNNRELLEELAQAPLTRKPTPTQFLAILVGSPGAKEEE